MSVIRRPAVAGKFYPSDTDELRTMLDGYLEQATGAEATPKAIIAPHAGYIYSGPIAASAYACLKTKRDIIKRVILLGPTHCIGFRGIATTTADVFSTPLGDVPIDTQSSRDAEQLPQVIPLDQAHAQEHSLEVHLPFLQEVLSEFSVVPLVVGDATPEEVGEVITRLWGGPETIIVISSDLSHYYSYRDAQVLDKTTSHSIEQLDPASIRPEQACGRIPIQGLLTVAQQKGLNAKAIDVRNSGDTAGPKDQVVGYGAYLFN